MNFIRFTEDEPFTISVLSNMGRYGAGAREPWGQGGQMTPKNLPVGQTWYFGPQIFLEKKISGIDLHAIDIIIIF